jgi:hypothetical protein
MLTEGLNEYDLSCIEHRKDGLKESVHWDRTFIAVYAEKSVHDIETLLKENERLRAKIKSGVEAAHDIQKKYQDWERPTYLSWYDKDEMADELSIADDAAIDILEAMGEPQYRAE